MRLNLFTKFISRLFVGTDLREDEDKFWGGFEELSLGRRNVLGSGCRDRTSIDHWLKHAKKKF